MVAIRLARYGTNKKAFYRIMVADKKFARNGRSIENVGTYSPYHVDNKILLKEERLRYWLEKGAQPSLTVKNLLKKSNFKWR